MAQTGRVLDSRPRGGGFEPHWLHCIVSLSKNINPSLVLVQPRKTLPFTTERLLMECKESNQMARKNMVVIFLFVLDELALMYEMCAFERSIYNRTEWCDFLKDSDRKIMEYRADLEVNQTEL